MTKQEFEALLAIEGRKLRVEPSMFRGRRKEGGGYELAPYYRAYVYEEYADGEGRIIVSTDWVQRRSYAVKSLAKRYYDEGK